MNLYLGASDLIKKKEKYQASTCTVLKYFSNEQLLNVQTTIMFA